MRTLFKRDDVIKFLHNWDCTQTAEELIKKSNNAEFLDSKFVQSYLIKPIYKNLTETLNQYTYKQ